MEKKTPPTSKEVARELAAFIVRNFHCCPIDPDVPVTECDCWGSDLCAKCIARHVKELAR